MIEELDVTAGLPFDGARGSLPMPYRDRTARAWHYIRRNALPLLGLAVAVGL